MARPMTAEDRVPEVGDVLVRNGHYDRLPFVLTVEESGRRDWVRFFCGHDKGDRGAFVTSPEDGRTWPRWRYLNRADGGPVTVEEG